MKTLKCDYCDDNTDFPDDTEITGYLCEKCWNEKMNIAMRAVKK